MQTITGAAIGEDGSIYTVGGTGPINGSGSIHVYAGKVNSDGTKNPCNMIIGEGPTDDVPMAMTLGPPNDGNATIIIAGYTQSANFPTAARGSAGSSPFLLRVDLCNANVLSYIRLPASGLPSTLLTGRDGTIYLGQRDLSDVGKGIILRLDSSGNSILGRASLRGVPGALAQDRDGSIFVTGLLPAEGQIDSRIQQGFAAKLSGDLQKSIYDVSFGTGPITMGTALTLDQGGALYVAAAAIPIGSPLDKLALPPFAALPRFDNPAALLVRILQDGKIDFERFTETATTTTFGQPVGLGVGPDGRIWLGTAGSLGLPQTLHSYYQIAVRGLTLRSFLQSGEQIGEYTLIPAKSQSTVAYGANGKMATVAMGRNLPVTPGSVNSESSNPLAVVSFDLNSSDAMSISADREMVDIDTFVLGSSSPSVFRDAKAVTVTASASTSTEFFTALDWERMEGFQQQSK